MKNNNIGKKTRILITDNIDESAIRILKSEFPETAVNTGLSKEELRQIIHKYDVLITRSRTQVDKGLIEKGSNLRLIVRAGVGIDNIDLEAASEKGIYVMNCPSGNTRAVAEHTFGLMIALSRNIAKADISLKSGKWEKKSLRGHELYKKTLGIIGLGRIGSAVAGIAKSFSMQLIAYDPYIKKEKAECLGVELVPKQELLKKSDYITIHTPLTDETKNMITLNEIKLMKKTAYIINAARGGIINEKDLAYGLSNNLIRGAAVDVFENEPNINKKLLGLDNIIVTPHIGGSTFEALTSLGKMAASQVINAIKFNKLENVVNLPYKDIDIDPAYQAFLELAEKIGTLHYVLSKGRGPISSIKIECLGEISKISKKIAVFALKGYLEKFLDININEVNAFIVASHRNIKVIEEKSEDSSSFKNMLRVRADYQDNGSFYINGTIFGKKYLRIIRLGEYRTDFYPEGNILIVENRDVPGVIGRVGTILGKNNINIGEWRQGKNEKIKGMAMGVINLDTRLPEKAFNEIKSFPDIIKADYIEM